MPDSKGVVPGSDDVGAVSTKHGIEVCRVLVSDATFVEDIAKPKLSRPIVAFPSQHRVCNIVVALGKAGRCEAVRQLVK